MEAWVTGHAKQSAGSSFSLSAGLLPVTFSRIFANLISKTVFHFSLSSVTKEVELLTSIHRWPFVFSLR
jgi:hypothetical protein